MQIKFQTKVVKLQELNPVTDVKEVYFLLNVV
jgi:hypothetical protein